MYIKGHVETVYTKDQSNAIVYWVWYLVCGHCRYKGSKQCYWVLSMVSCLSTVSIQRIKAMLLCFEYGILFVDTVDTKDQSNAIGYWVWYLVCRHCRYKGSKQCYCVLSMVSCLSTLSIQRIKAMLLGIEYGILFVDTVDTKDESNAVVFWVWYLVCRHCRYEDQSMQGIECYLCRHCRYKTHPHIPAHNFLNIQWIFNLQKVLESWDLGLFNHTIYTIYVDTVDTRQGSLMHSMLSMSTLSIQNTSTHSCS